MNQESREGEREQMHSHIENEQRIFTLEDVFEFAGEARYRFGETDEHGGPSRCVDGRYPKAEDLPGLAQPGADVSDFLSARAALRALEIDPAPLREDLFDAIAHRLGGPEKFRFHTDTHAHGAIARGCGHMREAAADPSAYGLVPDDMTATFARLTALQALGARQDVLLGDHEERGVIIVDSETESLYPMVARGDETVQSFIFQRSLHRKRLDSLTKLLAGFARQISPEALRDATNQAFEVQLARSLGRLAHGKPLFMVTIGKDGNADVEEAGMIN